MRRRSSELVRFVVVVVVNKGQTLSDYWRLVNKYDRLVWLQSRATLVCNAKSLDDQHIVVINYVIRYSGRSTDRHARIASMDQLLRCIE